MNISGKGRVSVMGVDCASPSCTFPFPRTTTDPSVALAATADVSSVFQGWSGAGCSGTGLCSVTLSKATTVTASFALKQFTLTLVRGGPATGAVRSTDGRLSCGATCSAAYNYGDTVDLTESPDGGVYFGGWSGGCSGMAAQCMVTMTADRTVGANFTYANYIFVTPGEFSVADVKTYATSGATAAEKMLAGGDWLCNTYARSAGLRGTYKAFLSTAAQDATERIRATGAQGWVRPDGKPVINTMQYWVPILYPPTIDAYGSASSGGEGMLAGNWDGGWYNKDAACDDWTRTSPDNSLRGLFMLGELV